jgi:imidazoleglycerol-phosphate dehydratase / histidinol-phosphatase
MKKVLFIDRDGTIIEEPADEQVDSFEKMVFLPGAITALSGIARETGFELVMVTNQDGLGTGSFPEEEFWPVHNKVLQVLKGEGVIFREVFIDRSLPHDNLPTRKPGTAMLTSYLAQGTDLAESYVIGDRLTDVQLAKNLGCNAILIGNQPSPDAVLTTTDWNEVYRFLKNRPRVASVTRKTLETQIKVTVNLDGSGKSSVSTGIGFFNHMLDQVARHGNIDLEISAEGDLEIDEHHTIEDVGLALGEAFLKGLGSKKGIERYGFALPMDDCLAQAAIDFGGRPWLVWDATFTREKIGEMPAEMIYHFFKSFSDSARCNLNITAAGTNEHHKAEAIFKAFAKSIKMAVQQTSNYVLPSTKGAL